MKRLGVLFLLVGFGCDGGPPEEPVEVVSGVFKDGFEDVGNTGDLFASSRWTGSQRQPEANRVEISTERSRTGERSVRFEAQPYDGETASKADLILNRLDLREGDPVWVEFWVWVEGGGDTRDLFVWDLEAPGTCTDETSCPAPGTGSICSTPGRRLYLGGPSGRAFTSDLGKWCRGDTFRAASETFETERWVRIRVFMSLSSTEAGQLRVWQDDQTVIDATGITLPRADAVYSQMQVGITANGSRSSANVLFLDDVSIWTEDPLWDAPATGVR